MKLSEPVATRTALRVMKCASELPAIKSNDAIVAVLLTCATKLASCRNIHETVRSVFSKCADAGSIAAEEIAKAATESSPSAEADSIESSLEGADDEPKNPYIKDYGGLENVNTEPIYPGYADTLDYWNRGPYAPGDDDKLRTHFTDLAMHSAPSEYQLDDTLTDRLALNQAERYPGSLPYNADQIKRLRKNVEKYLKNDNALGENFLTPVIKDLLTVNNKYFVTQLPMAKKREIIPKLVGSTSGLAAGILAKYLMRKLNLFKTKKDSSLFKKIIATIASTALSGGIGAGAYFGSKALSSLIMDKVQNEEFVKDYKEYNAANKRLLKSDVGKYMLTDLLNQASFREALEKPLSSLYTKKDNGILRNLNKSKKTAAITDSNDIPIDIDAKVPIDADIVHLIKDPEGGLNNMSPEDTHKAEEYLQKLRYVNKFLSTDPRYKEYKNKKIYDLLSGAGIGGLVGGAAGMFTGIPGAAQVLGAGGAALGGALGDKYKLVSDDTLHNADNSELRRVLKKQKEIEEILKQNKSLRRAALLLKRKDNIELRKQLRKARELEDE